MVPFVRLETPKSAILTQIGSGDAIRTFCTIECQHVCNNNEKGGGSRLRLYIAVGDIQVVECG